MHLKELRCHTFLRAVMTKVDVKYGAKKTFLMMKRVKHRLD